MYLHDSDSAVLMARGRLFQSLGAVTQKAQSPFVFRLKPCKALKIINNIFK